MTVNNALFEENHDINNKLKCLQINKHQAFSVFKTVPTTSLNDIGL